MAEKILAECNVRDGQNVQVPIKKRARRRRTVYSKSNLALLLKLFETNPYPGISVRESLSQSTGIDEARLQVWFQNHRARKKKKIAKEEAPHQKQTSLQLNPAAPQDSVRGDINPEQLGQPDVASRNLHTCNGSQMSNPAEYRQSVDHTVETISLQDLLEGFQPQWRELAFRWPANILYIPQYTPQL